MTDAGYALDSSAQRLDSRRAANAPHPACAIVWKSDAGACRPARWRSNSFTTLGVDAPARRMSAFAYRLVTRARPRWVIPRTEPSRVHSGGAIWTISDAAIPVESWVLWPARTSRIP